MVMIKRLIAIGNVIRHVDTYLVHTRVARHAHVENVGRIRA